MNILVEMATLYSESQSKPLTPFDVALAQRTLKANVNPTPQVAFVQFGKRKLQPVIPGLMQLQQAIDIVVALFADEV
jgi:hypothetical protein